MLRQPTPDIGCDLLKCASCRQTYGSATILWEFNQITVANEHLATSITETLFYIETSRYIMKQAPVLFFILSRDGEIIEANEYACRLVGRSLIGETVREVVVDLSGHFNLTELMNDATGEKLITIGTGSGLPQSFYFTFKQVSDHILAFGRLDAD